MFFRILKKDLKRKKTMNIILFAFILLATMFVSSGLSNVAAVMNGTDYFLKKAGVGDYVVIMMGTDTDDPIKDVLNEQEDVKEYRKENVVFGNKSDLTDTKGKALEARNATVYQAIEDSKLKFFDSKNEKIKSIEPGHAYATGDFMQKNDLQPGDKIAITYGNVKLSVILDGEAKDALLGSSMMGNNRFLLSKQDEGKLADDTAEGVQQGKIYYIDLKSGADESKLASAVSGEEGVTFSGTHSMIKMCYLIDMIVAFLMLVLSVCMMLVSFIVLKFSITFTISGEFREIGVLKAIGIKSTNIRGLYMAKYLFLAIAGAIGGFICSIPFSNMMLESVSRNMVLGGGNSYYALEFAGAFIVVAAILLFAFRCTKLVKKLSPIDAIRSGQTGERYNRKSPLRLGKSRGSTSRFLTINDVLSAPRRYATIITIIDKSTKRIGTVGINPSDFPFNFYLFICCPDDRYQCVHHLPLVLKADILPVIQIPGNAFHLLHRHSVRREFCNLIGNGLPPCVQLLNFAVGIGEQNRACARQRVKQLFNLAFHLRQFQPLCRQLRGDFRRIFPACQRLKIF